jgi:hypothetical protein
MSVDIIYAMGDDAFVNAFDLQFGPINIPGISDLSSAALRVENLTVPGLTINEYDVNYKSMKITKPNGKIEDPKEFTFTIRLDRPMLVYRLLIEWQKLVQDPNTGAIGADNLIESYRMPFLTVAPSSPGVAVALPEGVNQWTFRGVYPKAVPEIPFDFSSGDPIKLSVTMGMLSLDNSALFV